MSDGTHRVCFSVPGRPPQLANARLHWAQRMRRVRERKELAWGCAVNARMLTATSAKPDEGYWRPTQPRRAKATIYICGKTFDRDGAYAAIKPELDGIVHAALLVDDSEDWVTLEVQQERVPHRTDERVEWEVSW